MSVFVGGKIKILTNNPQNADALAGDIGIVTKTNISSFIYVLEKDIKKPHLDWIADYDQEGITFEKFEYVKINWQVSEDFKPLWSPNDGVVTFTSTTGGFALGQRVAVYDSRLVSQRQIGTVSSLEDPNGSHKEALVIEGIKRYDEYTEIIVHPKQCRKLKEYK